MSDTKHVVVTREGLQRMKEELEYKETTEKMKVAEQLKVAISYGDLSENAEYDAAKNDQAVLEQRITIVYEDEPDDEETYTIVGTSESDPANGKLSNESPVGEALIGAHVGETVTAQTPGGPLRIKVIEITL